MHKILIMGAGSLGVAAQLSSLASRQDLPLVFIGSADLEPVKHQHVDVGQYDPLPHSHSFEGGYFPTAEEIDWLDQLQRRSEVEIVKVQPPVITKWERVAESIPYQVPRYHRQFTQPQGPTTRDRKAARRRKKAGRKASR